MDGGGGGIFLLASSACTEDVESGGGDGAAGFFGAGEFGKGGAEVEGGVGGTEGGNCCEGIMGETLVELSRRLCIIEDEISFRNGLPLSPDSVRLGGDEDGKDGDEAEGVGGAIEEGVDGIREDTFFGGFGGFDGANGGIGGADVMGGGGAGDDGDGGTCVEGTCGADEV